MVHFRREKYVSRGGPDGGDGGKGGDIVIEVAPTLNTLAAFRKQSKFLADNGKPGGVNKMTGASAQPLVVMVPPGTTVYDADNGEVLGDLVNPGQQVIICRGGRGGRGNTHFASSRHQAPRIAEKGEPGEERTLKFELKLIADVGIVGVPNAGKSSLLAAVTNATPKVAEYPFTTIEPNLGVVELDLMTTLVLADIPGLIEGAHLGVGLGDAFLRHVQRTKVLIHVLDGLAEDPIADFSQINNEMALFDPNLSKKPQLVAFNKMDLLDVQDRWPMIKDDFKNLGFEVYPVSALARTGLEILLWKVVEMVKTYKEPISLSDIPIYRAAADNEEFTVKKVKDGWRVSGVSIERSAAMTYWEHDESIRRFQRLMEKVGVDDELRKAGVKPGESVFIGEFELEWQD